MRNLYYTERVIVNDDYDPRFSNNGGCYYQPTINRTYSDGIKVVVEDSSCGEFGDRFNIMVTTKKGACLFEYYLNSISGDACNGEECHVEGRAFAKEIHLVEILRQLPRPYQSAASAADAAEKTWKKSGLGLDDCKINVVFDDEEGEWMARVFNPITICRRRRRNGRRRV